jgi:hypothetical protein
MRTMGQASKDRGYLRDRRTVLAGLAMAVGLGWGGAAGAQSCGDPAALSGGSRNMRRALGYKEASPDPKRQCGGCGFFKGPPSAACGTCAMLSGGAVAASAGCNSWTPKT